MPQTGSSSHGQLGLGEATPQSNVPLRVFLQEVVPWSWEQADAAPVVTLEQILSGHGNAVSAVVKAVEDSPEPATDVDLLMAAEAPPALTKPARYVSFAVCIWNSIAVVCMSMIQRFVCCARVTSTKSLCYR